MNMLDLDIYFQEYSRHLYNAQIKSKLVDIADTIKIAKKQNKKIVFIGNGAGCAISAHLALDMNKQVKIHSVCLNDNILMSAYCNDFGLEASCYEALKPILNSGDILIVTSVSGTSKNLVNALSAAKENGAKIISVTGRDAANPIRQNSDIELWVNSHAYNIVEGIAMIWLTAVVDILLGKAVYEVS